MFAIEDRIGGGDAFAAGFINALLQCKPIERVLDEAMASAVLKHSCPGDASCQTQADIDEFLETDARDIRR